MHKSPVFLIREKQNHERLAYEQNIFIERTILGRRISQCSGHLEAERCVVCGAPTQDTPHPSKEDMMDFSTYLEALPDLMCFLLRAWPLQDLRLLGEIMRVDDPLLICQDVIHVYQKRHPSVLISFETRRLPRVIDGNPVELVHREHIRQIAQDVYFIPSTALLPTGSDGYRAGLLIGRVVAYLVLSEKTRQAGDEDPEDQWLFFAHESVSLALAEQPIWYDGWHGAMAAFLQTIEDLEAKGKGD